LGTYKTINNSINLSHLYPGIYFLELKIGDTRVVKKIIKN